MLSGYAPFTGNDHKDIFFNTLNSKHHFEHEEFEYVSNDAKDLINLMLVKNPQDRISVKEILEHSFFIHKTDINLESKLKDRTKFNIEEKIQKYQQANVFTKAISMCMSHIKANTDTNHKEMQQKFLDFDENGNGILEIDEFKQALK